MQNRKIPATVVTGFLGAGKTSLVRHALGAANGRRIAVIVNEFGDLGIDEAVLRGCGDDACDAADIVELANGCLCCTVADDFVPAIESLLACDPPPEHILIETSGLALPKPLVAAFNWPEIRTRLTVDGVIAVVDGPALAEGRFADDEAALQAQREADDSLDHESPLAEVFEDQVACADLVILNKTDLLAEAGAGTSEQHLRPHLRRGARVVKAAHGRIPPSVLLGLEAAAEDNLDGRPSHHDGQGGEHDHDEFESFAMTPVAIEMAVDPGADRLHHQPPSPARNSEEALGAQEAVRRCCVAQPRGEGVRVIDDAWCHREALELVVVVFPALPVMV